MPNKVFWRTLWSLEVPEKVKMFIWRTCQACLPTAVALQEKRVNIDSICSWCRAGVEDTIHVLVECEYAKKVWESLGMAHWVQGSSGDTGFCLFKRLFSTGTKEQCLLLVLTSWSI